MKPHFVVPPILNDAQRAYLISGIQAHNHTDEGHGSGGHHISLIKPHSLKWVAELFSDHLGILVDEDMKLYHLTPGKGAVPPHQDSDFEKDGLKATYSLLIHLNDSYKGGETLFDPNVAPKVEAGGALAFDHKILHSGNDVIEGNKYILKTDVFVPDFMRSAI